VNLIDARVLLADLVGKTIPTIAGRPNTILRIAGDDVIVGTRKSPSGQPVPIAWVQDALDRLVRDGEIEISVESVGYRSAFIGAVLAVLPGAVASRKPRSVQLGRPQAQFVRGRHE
jgi:hypothetical protein